ncbi:MAG: extracellular solute-binding protein [Chloroflexi bacterium]|nr:extracellular solute-binding protein [Chloroflexota bacterium]
MRRFYMFLLLLVVLLSVTVPVAAQDQPAITVWTKFNSENPQNSQDEWMRAAIDGYLEATGNQVTNVFQAFDVINSALNLAVQAGGDVPDLSYVDAQFLGFYDYNGTLTDLTDWITQQSWYDDLAPGALAACTTPDGRVICVPTATPSTLVYYWTERYPDGFPTSAEALLEDCSRLTDQGLYALTFKGTESFGLEVAYHSLIRSSGAAISDEEGRAAWANEAMVGVIEYVRQLFADGCVPEIALASGFDFENSFKDSTAGAILAGTWTYVFSNPVTAPDGTLYDLGSDSILTAAEEGQIAFAPPLAFEGGSPAANVYATAWAVPVGSPNPDAALAFINYTMQSTLNGAFGAAYGSLPSLISARDAEIFQTDYWVTVAEIMDAYGTPMPFLVEYDRGISALADVFARCLADPSLDIMTTLQEAQDNYNAAIQ